jgi:uncharacterized iron-regulated protein
MDAAAYLNGELPLSFNLLDPATADALSQEEEFLRKEETAAANDAIFTFRGEQLLKTNPDGAVRYMSRRNAVFFGETHDSVRDKRLATRILRQLQQRRKLALGLEMVQQPFQPVLDWYVYRATPSKAADRTLRRETEWDSRWGWDFDAYLPILKYAQLHKVPTVALNVEAELTSRVREYGLSSLSRAERARLIMDPEGFREDTIAPSFAAYADAVLRPSFDAHVAMGMFSHSENAFSNFVSNRILWDETMASVASRFLLKNPDYLLCGLVGGAFTAVPCRVARDPPPLSPLPPRSGAGRQTMRSARRVYAHRVVQSPCVQTLTYVCVFVCVAIQAITSRQHMGSRRGSSGS